MTAVIRMSLTYCHAFLPAAEGKDVFSFIKIWTADTLFFGHSEESAYTSFS